MAQIFARDSSVDASGITARRTESSALNVAMNPKDLASRILAGSKFDRTVKVLGIISMLTGAAAYVFDAPKASAYFISAGFLMYAAIEIGNWWNRD
ncbi:MAG TPA: hypothetical protein VGP12_01015 [Nitrosospira sp.]|nr:hypothetical protein [Nitrosospira sp.]